MREANDPKETRSLNSPPVRDEETAGANARTSTYRHEFEVDAAEASAPEKVGRYEIGRRLGRGAFGAVYLAWDPHLKRQVAVKVPRLEAGDDKQRERQIEEFITEAQRAVQLERHQGIVPVYDVGREGDVVYIISQYIEGGTLSERIGGEGMPHQKAVRLVAKLADIVQFAHRRGWVHRDIKPSNILLEVDGSPYLADFGLTTPLDELRKADSQPQGTPNYMAPEVFRVLFDGDADLPRPDHRCDVYSLGVVLYQLLTGRLPFSADDLDTLFEMVRRSDPPPLRLFRDDIPHALERVCLKALAKDPSARYQTAADFRDQLDAVADALDEIAPAAKPSRPVGPLLTPLRMAAAIAAAVLMALIVAVVVIAVFAGGGGAQLAPDGGDGTGDDGRAVASGVDAEPNSPADDAAPNIEPVEYARALGQLRKFVQEEESPRSQMKGLVTRGKPDREPVVSLSAENDEDIQFFELALNDRVARETSDGQLPQDARQKNAEIARKLKMARRDNDKEGEFDALLSISNQLVDEGEFAAAEAAGRRMVAVAENDTAKAPIAHGQLGLAQAKQGKSTEALDNYGQSLKVYGQLSLDLAENKDRVPKAAHSHMARLLAVTLNRIGNVYKDDEEYEKAADAYQKAEKVLDPFDDRDDEKLTVALSYGSLESRQGRHEQAVERLGKALKLAERRGDRDMRRTILVNLANAHNRAGDNEAALASYADADRLLDEDASYEFRTKLLINWLLSLLEERRREEARPRYEELKRLARSNDAGAQEVLKLVEPIFE